MSKKYCMISYDAEFDVMSYKIGDTSNSYGDEDPSNIVTLRDFDTDTITGYTILNFRRICDTKSKEYSILSSLFDIQSARKECGI